MKRALTLGLVLALFPSSVALAEDLGELLTRSSEASFTAEQVVSCSTPDGDKDAVVRLSQAGGSVSVASPYSTDVEVSVGAGDWTMTRGGDVVSSVGVQAGVGAVESQYVLDPGRAVIYLGRVATAYEMTKSGVTRASLVFDDHTGALMRAVSFDESGSVYCERRFISFDATEPAFTPKANTAKSQVVESSASMMPEEIAGFQRLDSYGDGDGLIFAYYSDGFFSFAVFETPVRIDLAEPVTAELADSRYQRRFVPGQVTYAWETPTGGMAVIGDMPPDMHESVLQSLPMPDNPGIFRRLWRSLFG